MKKLFLSICLLISSFIASAQTTIYAKPVVDERMELMGIIARYVGLSYYTDDYLTTYCKEIDKHFAKYKNHPIIKMSERLVPFGVSFDAIADFAILLEIKNNKIVLNDQVNIQSLDDRWPRDSVSKYLVLLNDFYRKTKFRKFFEKTSIFRQAAEESFQKEIVNVIDFDWFGKFFRYQPQHKFRIIISLLTGNYGISMTYKDGSEEYYAIMECRQEDENNLPMFRANSFLGTETMLIHEICHSFCDEPIDTYLDQLMPQATVLYELNREELLKHYCGTPRSLLGELFVRAAVFQYEKDHNVFEVFNVRGNIREGYLGLYQLLDCFEKYVNDTGYKKLTDFMPQIISYLNSFDFKKIYREDIPEIKYANIENGSDNVDCNLDSIVLYFNTEMYKYDKTTLDIRSTPGLELVQAGVYTNKVTGKKQVIGKDKWSEDGKEWTFYFKKLQPDTQYEIRFGAWSFTDKKDKYILKDDYILKFKTKK